MSAFTSGHALVVGVGGDLPNTVSDAIGLADILKDEGRCAYPAAQLQLLTGEQASRANLMSALDNLANSTTAESTVVVYYSGHGYQVSASMGKAYFLLPYGYDVDKLSDTAISGTELVDKLKAIRAQKLLLLLDCCHAGALSDLKAPGLEFAKAPLPPEAQSLLAQGRGRVVIASSKDDEYSFAGKPYSAFTLALIEALNGAGVAKQDGYVRVTDLALHTREKVPQRTKNRQHPLLHFEQADNFILAYYAGGDSQPKGLPFKEPPEIEPEPGAWSGFNQQGQTVQGPQTNIAGDVQGPVLSGNFQGPVQVGDKHTVKNVQRTTNQGGGVNIQGQGPVNITGDVVGRGKVSENITVGNITSSSGVAIGRRARSTVTQTGGARPAEMPSAFDLLRRMTAALPPGPAREDVEDALKKLEAETQKGAAADEGRIQRLLATLRDAAPAVHEAACAALGRTAQE